MISSSQRPLPDNAQQSQQTNIHAPRRAEDFYLPLKIRRLRSGLNPRTWVPKASTLPLDHRSRWFSIKSDLYNVINRCVPSIPQAALHGLWKPIVQRVVCLNTSITSSKATSLDSSSYSFLIQYELLVSLRSSSSCLRLLPLFASLISFYRQSVLESSSEARCEQNLYLYRFLKLQLPHIQNQNFEKLQ